MGATNGTGNAYPSGAPEFAPVCFTCLSGSLVLHVVRLLVFTFLVPCFDVRFDFRVKTMNRLDSHLYCRGFMFYLFYLYLLVSSTIYISYNVRVVSQ
jgi:hypothetical protein